MECHVGIVQDIGVSGPGEGRHLAVRVDVVPLEKVLHDLLHDRFLALQFHLVKASLGPDLRRGGHEYLNLSIGEYGRSDVAAVHDNPFALSESVEFLIYEYPHKWNG